MLRIHSSHINGFSRGKVSLTFFDESKEVKTATFSVPADFKVGNDAIAATAIAIRPMACSEIEFNFPVSIRARDIAEKDYKIEIKSEVETAYNPTSRYANYLNFSGGIDSLAAYYLLGDASRNISIDFGGYFKREADWFREWPTYIVETDFREKPFIESLDWRFMGSCAMLYSDYLQIDTVYWGTVLEASPYWFSSNKKVDADNAVSTHAFAIAGLKMGQTVTPLSEFGTMKLALQLGDITVQKSIVRCAAPRSEKSIRKLLLARLAQGDRVDSAFWEVNQCTRKYVFGTSFAVDILTMYFISKIGIKLVRAHLADITDDQLAEIKALDMCFFEKYNVANLESIPKSVCGQIIAGYENAGLAPYSLSDFTALEACRDYLKQVHRFM